MNYQKKYLKYKIKYLNLKGGADIDLNKEDDDLLVPISNFEIFTLDTTKILYHGTPHKLDGPLKSPCFFSTDILQSIGHILVNYNVFNYTRLNLLTSYFPTIHCFKPKSNINLLKINKPYIFSKSFDLLFNTDVLVNILHNSSGSRTGGPRPHTRIIDEFVKIYKKIHPNVLNNPHQKYTFKYIKFYIDSYKSHCKFKCFTGWTDTPGYYLLKSIGYNKYFKKIGLIPDDITIDGIYVEQDQDEIILFNTTIIESLNEPNNILYIFPYMLKDADLESRKSFITNYKTESDKYKIEDIFTFNLENIIDQYIYIDREQTQLWDINFLKNQCEKFDPLVPIYDDTLAINMKGCAEFKPCKKNMGIEILDDLECKSGFKSHKISIDDSTKLDQLKDYIEKIKTWNEPELKTLLDTDYIEPINTDRV
jgi:hypothetical protein